MPLRLGNALRCPDPSTGHVSPVDAVIDRRNGRQIARRACKIWA